MTRITNETLFQRDLYKLIDKYIDSIKEDLWALNKQIHDNPETAFKEHNAHDTVAKFLEDHNRSVTRHAYGLETAFESCFGSEGRLVNLNAEYDALPGLGHACGHNLICTASVVAYMALSRFLEDSKGRSGRVQLLGTPAEEGGGGKIMLLDKGAYKDVEVSLMAHPTSELSYTHLGYSGISGQSTLATTNLNATYTGRSAHAAANPWDGLNALDAIVASYNNISLLRQQIRPDQRIHGAIQETPKITNAIPEHTKIAYTVRAATLSELEPLVPRVEKCIEAGALATGCELSLEHAESYADVKVNAPLSRAFTDTIANWNVTLLASTPEPFAASTDMGNISYAVPGLHAMVGVPTDDKTALPHNRGFERVAGTREAFERFVVVGKALAGVAVRVWEDGGFVRDVRKDFEKGKRGSR